MLLSILFFLFLYCLSFLLSYFLILFSESGPAEEILKAFLQVFILLDFPGVVSHTHLGLPESLDLHVVAASESSALSLQSEEVPGLLPHWLTELSAVQSQILHQSLSTRINRRNYFALEQRHENLVVDIKRI